LLVTDLERGGTPLRLAATARGLRQAGVEVCVGCLGPRGPVSDDLAADGIATFACGARSAWDVSALWRLRSELRERRPDLIHATLFHANVAARLVGRTIGIPVLTSSATIEVERRRHPRIERLTAGLSRGHIVNGESLAEHARRDLGIPSERVHLVPPLVEPITNEPTEREAARREFGVPANAFVVAWIGRLDPVKRVDLAIHAVEDLADESAYLLIAGDGAERGRLKSLAEHSPVTDRIRMLGWIADPGRLLRAADVLLFPSLTEGMPNVVLQAMAHGAVVVGSAIPALQDLSGREGRLVLVDSAASADYAEALGALRSDPQRAEGLARRAQAWVREYCDPRASIEALLAVYRETLAMGA